MNTTKKIIFSMIIALIPVAILLFGYFHELNAISYDFRRKIIMPIQDVRFKNIKYNSYYFSGISGHDIFLGNYMASLHLLKTNKYLTIAQSITIYAKKNELAKLGKYISYVDSEQFYLFNGLQRSILKGETNKWHAKNAQLFCPYFSQSIPIGNNSVVYKIISYKTRNNSFRKESKSGTRIDNEKALEKQVDGIFCTDGWLEFNQHLKQLVYMYYYRNQILLLDTNLVLISKVKTIDPIDSAKFQITRVNSEKSDMFSSTRLLVNSKCSSWSKYLFVQSKIVGRNEDKALFDESTVLDVYDLENSKYLYSFYLPNLNFGTVRQFKVIDGVILALSGNFIISYRVQLPA